MKHHCYCKDNISVSLSTPLQVIFLGSGIMFLKFLQYYIAILVEESFWLDSRCSIGGIPELYALVKAVSMPQI